MIDWNNHELPISVVAAIFFDQKPAWIRYHEVRGRLRGIGKRRPGGDRVYTLKDIHQMAYAFLHYGIIDQGGCRNCISRIESMSSPVFTVKKQRRVIWD